MSFGVFLLMLMSVILHAAWNFLGKKCRGGAAFFCIASFVAGLCWCWAIPVYGMPGEALTPHSLGLWGISIFFQTIYFIGLFKAYSAADMSMTYPVARSLPVLMIAVVTAIIHPGRYPGFWGVVGLLVVSGGCLLMPLKSFNDFKLKHYTGKAMRYVLLAAIGTTGYTVTDAELARICSTPDGYNAMIAAYLLSFIINTELGITMGALTLLEREERRHFKELISSWRKLIYPVLTGVFSSIAYALVLAAMTMVTHLSFLQAFRQMSLPIGMLLGIIILKEPAHPPKLAGMALIICGLAAIYLLG